MNRVKSMVTAALLMAMVAATAAPLAAQSTGSVRGKVVDATTLRPVAGAQVSVSGTTRGTLTNSAGEFLIVNVPAGTQTVRVQMLGYSSMEDEIAVSAGETGSLDFQLTQSAIALDEVVVTGTPGGSQRRAIGNTVSSIQVDDITAVAPITDVQELLTARTPGLTLMSSSGQAGASSKIRIRGAGSLTAGNEPVIFVDGVRISSGTAGGYGVSGGTVQGTSPLDAINPNDIETIEVIKGPAAATLYGAEAASGVIQIITKKGRGLDGVQWTARVESGRTDWNVEKPTTYWTCTPGNIANPERYPGCEGMDPNASAADRLIVYSPLDDNSLQCRWTESCQPDPLRNGDVWGLNLAARGGGERYNFYLSGETTKENGVFYTNSAGRTSGRANFGFTPTDQLNFAANVSYARNNIAMSLTDNSSNGVLRNAYRGRPGNAGPYETGWLGFSPEISNQWDNRLWSERTIMGLTANYQPFSWLRNRLVVGMDKNDRINQVFYRIDETGRAPWGNTEATGEINRWMPSTHVWTIDYAGTVTTPVGEDYTSNLSVGMQYNARQTQTHEVIGEGLVANNLNLVGSAAVTRADQGVSEQNSLGFFAQEQVGWKDRLFVTGAVRVDDNSAFGRDFSMVIYPKASLSWVISEEPFFSFPAADNLRLRAAWGRAGNAPAPFSADRTLEPSITTVGDITVNRLEFDEYGNPNLKAETGEEIEVGFDASFFDGRSGVEVTYYNKRTKDALVSVPDPPSSGYSGNHLINVGEIRNSGFEVLLNATPVTHRRVTWDATLSFASNSNELVSFGRDAQGNPLRDEIAYGAFATVQKHIEGYPLGGLWAVDVKRDANGAPILDSRGNAIVDTGNEEFVGPMLPTREVAFSNSVTLLGNLRLYGNLDYKGGNYQWCAICSIRNRINLNTWEVNNPDASAADVAVYRSLQTKTWISPADYLKLRELSATYTLPGSWTRRMGTEQASITLAGRNLWMWTRYEGTGDPEASFYSERGFDATDYASTPMLRRLLVSMNFTF